MKVLPVFVLAKNVPEKTTVYDICSNAEKISGKNSIDGATCISGLWRIYPLTDIARIKLLTNGCVINERRIQLESKNPFSIRGSDAESPSTRLTISNLPFSYSNEAVERNLIGLGLKLRSNINMEKARDPNKKLTDWKTGRRFCFIDRPEKSLPKKMKMGEFNVFLFHPEMKNDTKCFRCLEFGHIASRCPNDEVCLTCKKSGHRKGDPVCGLGLTDTPNKDDPWGTSKVYQQSTGAGECRVFFCAKCNQPGHEEGAFCNGYADDKSSTESLVDDESLDIPSTNEMTPEKEVNMPAEKDSISLNNEDGEEDESDADTGFTILTSDGKNVGKNEESIDLPSTNEMTSEKKVNMSAEKDSISLNNEDGEEDESDADAGNTILTSDGKNVGKNEEDETESNADAGKTLISSDSKNAGRNEDLQQVDKVDESKPTETESRKKSGKNEKGEQPTNAELNTVQNNEEEEKVSPPTQEQNARRLTNNKTSKQSLLSKFMNTVRPKENDESRPKRSVWMTSPEAGTEGNENKRIEIEEVNGTL